jgi:hypothetical protein
VAIPTKTLSTILDRTLVHFRTSLPGWPLGTKRFLGRLARAVGLNIWGLQKAIEDIDLDIVPNAQSSTDALSNWASLIGLPDGAGGYGRRLATAASGGLANLNGVKGTIFPDGATATAEDGTTQIELSGSVTIPGSGTGYDTIEGIFVAITTGPDGNLPVGTVCTWDSPPAGADATFTITSALGGGNDLESNADLYARIVTRMQTPPRGGSSEDYVLWAQEVTGIEEVYVYPRRSGTGSVDLMITTGGTGTGRAPSASQQTDVEEVILENRPVAVEQVSVLLPYMPGANGLAIKVQVTPSRTRYDFDWDDTAATYTVDTAGYSAGPPATLRFNAQLAPASLKNAIDAYIADPDNNLAPRLQVISTGAVINPPIRVVAWSDGGGETTLTLETVPDGWVAPTAGDRVYAYGPVVETIASGLLALVDSLGPSRMSNFGDPLAPWFSELTISGLTGVAENAIDTDGTRLIQKVPVGNATINGVAADVEGDDTSTQNPELLYAKSIVVCQAT